MLLLLQNAILQSGTPIGLLLTLTREITSSGEGTPIGLLLTLTREITTTDAGSPVGLLLTLTKAN